MIRHSLELSADTTGLWFIVNRGQIRLTLEGHLPAGAFSSVIAAEDMEQCCWLGEHDGQPCYLLVNHDQMTDESCWVSPRELLPLGENIFQLAARAVQVALFLQTHRFCGQCGSAMHLVNWELAVLCNKCGHRCYPRIAPCVLVAVVRDKQILLARSSRHRKGFFSILAGFVESAEMLEQAAVREVKEEVGVDIANLRYVGSQPWPFPHSLMAAFIADYTAGDIVCQPNEIEEAYWFDLESLPEIPPAETLSGKLIRQLQADAKSR